MVKFKKGIWKGKRCFVVGGGPSLKDFDFDSLAGEYTIAVNRAFEFLPHSDAFITMDNRFYMWLKNGTLGNYALQKWQEYGGKKFILDTQPEKKRNYPECTVLKYLGNSGFPESLKGGLYSGANSGYAGLQLAIILGANPIILLGFDMNNGINGETHHHESYVYKSSKFSYPNYVKYFEALAPAIKANGIEVINVNDPKTCGLQCFEFGVIDLPKKRRRKNKWLVVSFFTDDYREDVSNLKKSLSKHGIKHSIKKIHKKDNSRYEWKMTTLKKAIEIYKTMLKNKGFGVVWIDADGVVQKYPELFDTIKEDVGVHYRRRKDGTLELLSGTIFFKNTANVRNMVLKWAELNKTHDIHDKSDQINLQYILNNTRNISVKNLPGTYTQIYDTMKEAGDPVIEHFQASRRCKYG